MVRQKKDQPDYHKVYSKLKESNFGPLNHDPIINPYKNQTTLPFATQLTTFSNSSHKTRTLANFAVLDHFRTFPRPID